MAQEMQQVLFISNGHGEDVIAARVVRKLLADPNPQITIQALPIVGTGAAYSDLGVPLLHEGHNLPSGGFIRNGLRNLAMDLRAGLFGLFRRQVRALQQARAQIDLAVCVGDVLLIILAGFYLRRPVIFLPTAKSDYVSPHWQVERWLMRRFCRKIFTRDALTAKALAVHGLPAEFLGNVMMDCLDYRGNDLAIPQPDRTGQWTIGILPGSRLEAYGNMEDIAQALIAFQKLAGKHTDSRSVRFLAALAGALSAVEIARRLTPNGWIFTTPDPDEVKRGVEGFLDYGFEKRKIRLVIAKGRFADILAASDLVVGLSGTGNEQAVGLGKPVVAFVGRGTQFTPKFVKTQQRLLGESVRIVERNPEKVAAAMLEILTNQPLREHMARVGRERMGGPGGAERIAGFIKQWREK